MELLGPATYVSLLLLSVVVSGVLAGFAIKYRHRRGATTFAVLVVCLFVWALAEAVGFVANRLVVARVARQVMFVAIPFIPVSVFALALQYTGREQYISASVIAMLAALPLMSAIIALTNPMHGLFWTGGELIPVGAYSGYVTELAIWYWIHVSYSYLLLAIASYLFVTWGRTAGGAYRKQARYLLVGIAFPWIANMGLW